MYIECYVYVVCVCEYSVCGVVCVYMCNYGVCSVVCVLYVYIRYVYVVCVVAYVCTCMGLCMVWQLKKWCWFSINLCPNPIPF